jgi:hypothetical protein
VSDKRENGKASANTVGVEETFNELQRWMTHLMQASAGYNKLSGALASVKGVQSGRKHGMPMFTMPATADGVHKVDVTLDLKKLQERFPQHVEHVLVPLANLAASDVLEALEETEQLFIVLKDHFKAVLGTQVAGPQG